MGCGPRRPPAFVLALVLGILALGCATNLWADLTLSQIWQGGSSSSRSVALEGDLAYVVDNTSLDIFDIANPDAPVIRGHYTIPRTGTSSIVVTVAVFGGFVYLAADVEGLVIVDARNPANPTLVATFGTWFDGGNANGVAVAAGYAYVADWYLGLYIVDIRNPTTPRWVGRTQGTINNARAVRVMGDYAYVVYGNDWTSNDFGLKIVDIRNPAAPLVVGVFNTPKVAYDVAITGHYALVAANSSLQVIDVSSPTDPLFVSEYHDLSNSSIALNVAVAGDYAFIGSQYTGLRVIDVGTPAAPIWVGTFGPSALVYHVAVSGDTLYLATGDSGLSIFRIEDADQGGLDIFWLFGTDSSDILPATDARQTFTPAKTPLRSVSVGLQTKNAGRGGDDVAMTITDGQGHEIYTATLVVAEGFYGWLRFELPLPGLSLDIGSTYAIHLKDTGKNVYGWIVWPTDVYAGGSAYGNFVFSEGDFYFGTASILADVLDTHTVTPSAGPNGSIDPSTPQTVNASATVAFTITPDSGYAARVGGTCGGTLVGNTYATRPIVADCTVEASFTEVFTADRVGVWRPDTARFYLDVDGSLTWNSGIDVVTASFGVATDRPVAGDWAGDGTDEIGVWRPSTGRFYLDMDGSLTWTSGVDVITASFGVATDRPVAGDWNGDGTDEIGVWRPSTGRFYLDMDGSRTWTSGIDVITASFGVATDRPVVGDWAGDGTDEIGVWRPSTGRFYLDMDGSRTWTSGIDVITASFGVATDRPVAGDWNDDGIDEIGVWRPSTSRFYLDVDGSLTWTPGVDVITDPSGPRPICRWRGVGRRGSGPPQRFKQ